MRFQTHNLRIHLNAKNVHSFCVCVGCLSLSCTALGIKGLIKGKCKNVNVIILFTHRARVPGKIGI